MRCRARVLALVMTKDMRCPIRFTIQWLFFFTDVLFPKLMFGPSPSISFPFCRFVYTIDTHLIS